MAEAKAKAKSKANELDLLYELLRDATKRSDLKGVFHVLFRGGKEGIGVQDAFVAQFNPEKGVLEPKVKTPGSLIEDLNLFSTSRDEVQDLIGLSEPVIRNKAKEMFFKESKSQLVTPVAVNSGATGLLVYESKDKDLFSNKDLEFVEKLVDQTNSVIHNRSRVESSKRELDCLWDVKRRIVTPGDMDTTELNALLGKILQLAMARTKTSNGIILMGDEKTGELITSSQAIMGDLEYDVPEKIQRRQRGKASGIAYWVYDNNKPYISGHITEDPNYIPLFKGVNSNLSVPISFQGRCIGVIVLESAKPNYFTLEDQKVVEELSKNVTILVRRAQLFEATKDSEVDGRGIMIRGLSPEWEAVERRVEKAAATNAIVMLRGESGTGKELVARSIHFNSKRKDKKLIIVNSSAIPDQLLESTLFGHVKGAFTGASYDRKGEFEKADGGTIFLDEIGDLGLPLQSKLLRVLQTSEIQQVGSNEDTKRVNVRVMAATSRNLEEMIRNKEFREDLYYRLHVVPIWLPPLRSYKKSVPGMVKAFIQDAAKEYESKVRGIAKNALDVLMKHDYPGNVRELKNIIEQSVIMADGKTITLEDLPITLVSRKDDVHTMSDFKDFKTMKKDVLERFEQDYLHEVLTQAQGNVSKASEISCINRVNFYKLLKRHEIDPTTFR
jgi:transcriptional regulator with GAF, ATPase, and Fis domain